MKKHIEIDIARKRRAKILSAWERFTGTKRDFAERFNLSPERIGKLISKAKDDLTKLDKDK